MLIRFTRRLSSAALLLAPLAASAQAPVTPPPAPAATVNGQPIPEAAVQRALKRLPPDKHAEARPEILDFLVENALVDQYLLKAQIPVTDAETDAQVKKIDEELKKAGQGLAQMLTNFGISMEEFRTQVTADLRWEKFANAQATDPALQKLFAESPEMFDGSLVRARHILLTPPAGDARALEEAKAQLLAYRKQIADAVAAELAKQPPAADPLAREKERCRLTEQEFGKVAREKSACPSKKDDGDVNWFPRAGSMVEPFAQAAFALRPFQMSDPVVTPFGVHLILLTDRKTGKPVKFEEVKGEVTEVFCTRLREGLIAQLKPAAQIVVTPVKP
jgi:peptidyl-prolyl cis-trans isomerase C